MRHVIIGNSAAGIRAAETIRSLDKFCEIMIIAKDSVPAYSRCLLPDYLEGIRDAQTLRIRPHDFYQQNNIKTKLGTEVVTIDTEHKRVILADRQAVAYDKLLIASGASSGIPPIPGINGAENVFGLRELVDADNILAATNEPCHVAVVGGGFVGIEAAVALRRRGNQITVIEKLPRILPLQFDDKAANILKVDMEDEGIRFILGTGIKEIKPPSLLNRLTRNRSNRLILEDGQVIWADVVVMATGTRPNTQLVKESPIEVNRGIPVNEYLQTNVPHIYAAGDVAETVDSLTRKQGLTPIWPNANAQGRVAAYNMVGIPRCYGGMIGMQNAVEFRNVPAISMGLSQVEDNKCQIIEDYRPEQKRYKKLVFKDDRLIGMMLVGDISQAGLYGALIKRQQKLGKISAILPSPHFNYGHMLAI